MDAAPASSGAVTPATHGQPTASGSSQPIPNRRMFGLLGASIVAVALYASYVANQYFRLSNLNQRELSLASVELGRTIENAIGTVNQLRHRLGRPNESKDTPEDPWLPAFPPALCAFDQDQPYLSLDGVCIERASQRLKKNP